MANAIPEHLDRLRAAIARVVELDIDATAYEDIPDSELTQNDSHLRDAWHALREVMKEKNNG